MPLQQVAFILRSALLLMPCKLMLPCSPTPLLYSGVDPANWMGCGSHVNVNDASFKILRTLLGKSQVVSRLALEIGT